MNETIMLTKRLFVLAASACLLALPAHARDAAKYPTRPVKMVVPYPAGGSLDTLARLVGEQLAASLGQPFIVENKPGASTILGNDAVARAQPDGHTLLWGAATIALNDALGLKQPYDVERDFVPISLVASMTMVFLVAPGSGYTSMTQVIDDAKKSDFFYASAGRGSIGDLITLQLNLITSSRFTIVPYRGSPAALQDVLGGNVKFMIDGYIPSGIRATTGELKAMAVTSRQRLPMLPNVPTMAELGYPATTASADFGLLAPKGTPAEIVHKLNAAVLEALKSPDVREKLVKAGYEIHGSSPEDYRNHIRNEVARWRQVVKATGLKVEP
jgi:tripartite-type tricarboxylate transporter receptor subunit TctC